MMTPIQPAILYFGTPVVLVSTLNEDGTPNLAPMSSAWWPLIMSFQQFYGLAPERVHDSTLARIPEKLYRAS